jgi:predicted nucleic acid-binding protein
VGLSQIFFDTNLFIYLFEKTVPFGAAVRNLRSRMLERGDRLLTSAITVGEILVQPLEMGRHDIAEHYDRLFRAIEVVPFDFECGRLYARIRQDRSIKAPDAIQLACAARARCDLFITNDERLSKKVIPGVQFIVPLDRVYL